MSITVQHQKEALGQAYVRAVIAKAGFNFGKSEHDYGYDGTIKEVVNRGGRYVESCFGINFSKKVLAMLLLKTVMWYMILKAKTTTI